MMEVVPDRDSFEVCFKNNRTVGSLGVFFGDNPLEFVFPITLLQIIITVLTSRTLYHLLRPLQTPRFICSVLGGVLLGPTFLGRCRVVMDTLYPLKQASFLLTVSKIGAIYFVFLSALKMDVTTTLKSAKRCWKFGVVSFFASYFVTLFLLGLYNPNRRGDEDWSYNIFNFPNFYTVTGFSVVSEALTELNLITTELGQIALSSAMINEILQWTTIGIHFGSPYEHVNWIWTIWYMTCNCLFIFTLFLIIRPLAKLIARRTPVGKPLNEVYVVMILLGVLVMAALSDANSMYVVFGPTLYGLCMPNGPPLGTTIIERTQVIVSELLMPVFFVYIGLHTNFEGIGDHWEVVLVFQAILFVGFLAKILACVLVAPSYNIRPKHGLVLGLILSIKGIIELIFFSRLEKLRMINEEIFSQMVLYVVLSTSVCVPLIKYLYKHRSRMLTTPSEGEVRTIQNTPQNSEFNLIACVHNDGNVHSMIRLLETLNPSLESPLCVRVIHLIELLGKSTPILLPMNLHNNRNSKSLSTNYPNTNHILRAFDNYSKNSKGPVTILPYINVAPFNSMHDAVCNLAEDNSVHFLIIPFHQNDQSALGGSHVETSIRVLNSSFQARVRCTVGILVDRYSRLSVNASRLSFHVAVFFVGGPDDREALALGIRMVERPNTNVTCYSFVTHNNNTGSLGVVESKENEEEEELESTLDDSLMDEFKGKIINGDNVVFHEIVVDDCIQVLEVIRGLGNDEYDLVMVGKRHNIGDLTDEEMTNFMDNANQLGIIGDMLASTEFCNGRVSVLVTQCGEKREKKFDKVDSANPISRLF